MTDNHDDTETILKLMAGWNDALQRKDVDTMMAHYHPDALLYDACPPYKAQGRDNIRNVWEKCLPYFPDEFRSEHRDLQVTVDGNLAFVHGIHHFVATPADHPLGQTWMRISICLQRINNKWNVMHEHVSVPFNPLNSQAWFISHPDDLSLPDYSSAGCESTDS